MRPAGAQWHSAPWLAQPAHQLEAPPPHHVCVCVYMYIYIYVCVCACVFVFFRSAAALPCIPSRQATLCLLVCGGLSLLRGQPGFPEWGGTWSPVHCGLEGRRCLARELYSSDRPDSPTPPTPCGAPVACRSAPQHGVAAQRAVSPTPAQPEPQAATDLGCSPPTRQTLVMRGDALPDPSGQLGLLADGGLIARP
jgi:hypothetical protein